MSENSTELPLRRGQAVRLDAVIHADPNPDLGLVTVNLERMEVDEALGPYRRSKIVTVPLDIVHDPQQAQDEPEVWAVDAPYGTVFACASRELAEEMAATYQDGKVRRLAYHREKPKPLPCSECGRE